MLKTFLISVDRSGEYQTVIKGYDTQTPTESKEDRNFEPLFGELYSNKSDYHQIFLNQNIIDTDNKYHENLNIFKNLIVDDLLFSSNVGIRQFFPCSLEPKQQRFIPYYS